jgi:hypothetical protein
MEKFDQNQTNFEQLREELRNIQEEEVRKKDERDFFNPNIVEMKIDDLTPDDLNIWKKFTSCDLTPADLMAYTKTLDSKNEGSKNLAVLINNRLMEAGDWFDIEEYNCLRGQK